MIVFGEGCPQHPDQPIASVTRERAASGWLVTATYACGHRHTQYTPEPVEEVRDTQGRLHAVLDRMTE